jgi:hypothetical protein
LPAHEVRAFNTAATSENKIHDDSVAQKFGFGGALVPGVEVYAYMAHQPVARWGRDWLERGALSARFLKPVYHDAIVRIDAQDDGDGLALSCRDGAMLCAEGRALAPQSIAPFEVPTGPLPPQTRPPASEATLATGAGLAIAPIVFDRDMLGAYLKDIGETNPIYLDEELLHPGQIARLANQALVQNVVLGPWIHVGSDIRHHSAGRLFEPITLDARITSNVDQKGHKIVTFDALALASGLRPIASIRHTAIWRPRQLA